MDPSIHFTCCFIYPPFTLKHQSLILEKPDMLPQSRNLTIPRVISFIGVSIRSRQLPSSSFPRPGLRALSACVPASREGPDILPRSGPGIPTRPLSALPPCNVAVHTSCGRRWSF